VTISWIEKSERRQQGHPPGRKPHQHSYDFSRSGRFMRSACRVECDRINTMSDKPNILGMDPEELADHFIAIGEQRYRADQIFRGAHGRRLESFGEMSDVPLVLRKRVGEEFAIRTLSVGSRYVSEDGTRRFLMHTHDGYPVETVFIPTEGRDTICFSSQSGCPLKCDFCLTAKLGLLRNLTAGEIVEQIIVVLNDVYGPGEDTPHGTNLVAMGAGEPFLNFDDLIKALGIMALENGLHIVPGRVTVSTAGIVPRIYDFAKLGSRPNLAISLSAATDELRDRLMPINKRWNIGELLTAAKAYERTLKRGERFTFEYVLLGGVNDSDENARQLADLVREYDIQRVKVNLIPHNPAEQLDYHPSGGERVERFKHLLEGEGISAYVRRPRGRDIFAACGQLAAKQEPNRVSISRSAI
jgi:23S rRNA (adenine2503-C2)-methyltransferase